VIDTSRFDFGYARHIFGGFLIVAMSVKDPFIAYLVSSAKSGWDSMSDF
jgi:hypothetical protein